MKVIAINGSPHASGNTYHALRVILTELEKNGIDSEILPVGSNPVRNCIGCDGCIKAQHCVLPDEQFNDWVEKIYSAEGFIIASPVYFYSMPGQLKTFLDRLFYQDRRKGGLRRKVGAAAVVQRRIGGCTTLDDLNRFLFAAGMLIAPAVSANAVYGSTPGEVLEDIEGIDILGKLGRNMAWLLKMLDATRDTVPPPPYEKRVFMNFIRPKESQ
jgi:multimeric flavodoxin WrbA